MKKRIFLLPAILFFLTVTIVQSQILDESFGKNGLVVTDLNGLNDSADLIIATAQQIDGKIIAMGTTGLITQYFGFFQSMVVARYEKNGILDSSFGINGVVHTTLGYYPGGYIVTPTFLKILDDGKILTGGYYGTSDLYEFLVRYDPKGALDSTFGNGGISIGLRGQAGKMVIQSDGQIICPGANESSAISFAALRYKSNGKVDSTFGINGCISVANNDNPDNELAKAAAIQPDQKIVLGGYSATNHNGVNAYDLALARFMSDGSLDSSFGINGKVKTFFDLTNVSGINAISIQQDGKILVKVGSANYTLYRYNSDGGTDSTFGVNGKVNIDIPHGSSQCYFLLQNDGKILFAGPGPMEKPGTQILRLKEDGSLDSTFGINGVLNQAFGSPVTTYTLMFQDDGNLINAGYSGGDFAIVRYIMDGVLPVKISSVTATKKEKTTLLNWETLSETNNAYFLIERSTNGNANYSVIGKVSSRGNGTQIEKYAFEDMLPIAGRNYYRLKQVDKNGYSNYSKTVFVDFSSNARIKIYPNPVKDILQIDGLDASVKTTISAVDLWGRTVAKIIVNSNSYSLNIKHLSVGNYYLIIEADEKISTFKFIKN